MCGGPSAKNKLEVGGDIIAVNRDIERYPESKYFVTTDNRFTVWHGDSLKNVKATKVFVIGMHNDYIVCTNHFSDRRFGTSYSLARYDLVIKSYVPSGVGTEWNDFRSGINSGFSAFQFALLLGYEEINLVGVDLCSDGEKTHHHDGYLKSKDDTSRRLDEFFIYWVVGIEQAKEKFPNVKVISRSPISRLNNIIPYIKV
jgi:hypothetical protein